MTPDLSRILSALPDQDLVAAFAAEVLRRGMHGIFYACSPTNTHGLHFMAAPENIDQDMPVGDQLRMFAAHADLRIERVHRVLTERLVGEPVQAVVGRA